MRKRQPAPTFQPFVFHNPYRVGAGPPPVAVAVMQVAERYLCLEFQMGAGEVVTFTAWPQQFTWRYARLDDNVDQALAALKGQALAYGATLEAIMLLGLTPQEEATMASKLTRKDGDAAALKEAAKNAPVDGKKTKAAKEPGAEGTKRKGNPEALAAARAKKAEAGPDKRKVTVTEAGKAHAYREGSGRADAWAKMKKAKTVDAYSEAGGPSKYVKRWEDEGLITLA